MINIRKCGIHAVICIPVLVGAIVVAGRPLEAKRTSTGRGKTSRTMVARGKYLVTTMGCSDCHSPHDKQGRPVTGREFSGNPSGAPLPEWDPDMLKRNVLVTMSPTLTAFAGPFGVSVADNITPDKATGIGKLTAEGLVRSWKTRKHWRTGRPILPPMPAEAYAKISTADMRAIHSYLMTLKPIRN